MTTRLFFLVLLLGSFQWSVAQNEHFNWLGLNEMPSPTDSIESLPYSGQANDFSGGYNVGDTISDFHLWTLQGEEFLLSNEVDELRPTILFNGSATCVRFQNDWNINVSPDVVDWTQNHLSDFNWVPIYVGEAHAIDTENCPSNCPDLPIPGPHGQYMWQHQTVQERIDAAQVVMDFMGPGSNNEWVFPFDDILIDAPNNLAYEHFFLRPAGIVVINCDGIVVARGNWLGGFISNPSNQAFLEGLVENPGVNDVECLLVSESQEPCDGDFVDSDGDGVCDAAEFLWGTDPFNPCDLGQEGMDDSDGDGNCDALEALVGSDPNDPCDPLNLDTDGDGFCDTEEQLMGSNMFNPCSPVGTDSDGDGYCDSEELVMGSDANDACSPDGLDSDLDGLCNSAENAAGTDPNDSCDPNGTDSDNDGLCDIVEEMIGSSSIDPCDPYFDDTDGDGLCDTQEELTGSDPFDACSPNDLDLDGDGWCSGLEMANGWNDLDPCAPIALDDDADGWCNLEEQLMGTDPQDPCSPDGTDTDGDGVCDIQELLDGTSPTIADVALGLGSSISEETKIQVMPQGFGIQCVTCLGSPFEVLDLSGRTVFSGRLQSQNVLNLPMGNYVLSLPSLGVQQLLPQLH